MSVTDLSSSVPKRSQEQQPMDWLLFVVTLVLLSFGVVMVFNASYPLAIEFYDDKWFFAKKQMLWAVIGLTGLFVARRIPYWKWQALAVPGLVLTSLLLIAVHFVGHDAQGGQRWIGYGPIRIQPSEFAKFALALYLAKVISARPRLTRELWGGVIPVLGVSLVS
ncbi:MAG: FtsW/RodA/SpoVE family cell cycle protein, partial [Cytophagales bacterium]|nr:FtsW/RodA/SpoVE family cell cycle protein [Armatimonadota bacterium]